MNIASLFAHPFCSRTAPAFLSPWWCGRVGAFRAQRAPPPTAAMSVNEDELSSTGGDCGRARYTSVLQAMVADGIITSEEKFILKQFRVLHDVTAEEHSAALAGSGWCDEEFNRGKRTMSARAVIPPLPASPPVAPNRATPTRPPDEATNVPDPRDDRAGNTPARLGSARAPDPPDDHAENAPPSPGSKHAPDPSDNRADNAPPSPDGAEVSGADPRLRAPESSSIEQQGGSFRGIRSRFDAARSSSTRPGGSSTRPGKQHRASPLIQAQKAFIKDQDLKMAKMARMTRQASVGINVPQSASPSARKASDPALKPSTVLPELSPNSLSRKLSDPGALQEKHQRLAEEEEERLRLEMRKRRCMLSPQHPFRIGWDMCTIILLAYMAVALPFSFGFDISSRPWSSLWLWENFIDIYFMVDVVLNFRTGFIGARGNEVMEFDKVCKNYLQTWFCLDVLSSIPFELLELAMRSSSSSNGNIRAAKLLKSFRVLKVMKLVRLARLAKLLLNATFMDKVEEFIYSSSIGYVWNVSRLVFGLFYTCHVLGCLWAMVGRHAEPSWINIYSDLQPLQPGEDDIDDETDDGKLFYVNWHVSRQYVVCLCT